MRVLTILLLAALIAPAAAAQNTFVAPNGFATKSGDTNNYRIFWNQTYQPVHVQLVYDTADITVASAVLKKLAFRRPNNPSYKTTNPARSIDLEVTLSVGPNDAAAATREWKKNLGPNLVSVFKGTINLPTVAYSAGLAPFNATVVFSKVFPYSKSQGKGLVVDFFVSKVDLNGYWRTDTFKGQGTGLFTTNWDDRNNCVWASGQSVQRHQVSMNDLIIGGKWWVWYRGADREIWGMGAMGLIGKGSKWFGLTLPFDLVPIGGAANCKWAVGNFLYTLPLKTKVIPGYGGYNAAWPDVPIPNDPVYIGAVFYDQGAFPDTKGLVATISHKWTIGSGTNPPGCSMHTWNDTTPPKANLTTKQNEAQIIQFTY